MVWETATNFAELYTRRKRRTKCWKRSNTFSSTPPDAQPPRKHPTQGTLLERTRPMVQAVSTFASRQRSERRIAVRLPMQVSGKDSRGVIFTEDTSCENLCRSGAAFLTRFEVAIGSDLMIRIPKSSQVALYQEQGLSRARHVGNVGN